MLLSELVNIGKNKLDGVISDDEIKDWFYKNNDKKKFLNTVEKSMVLSLIDNFSQNDTEKTVMCTTNYIIKELYVNAIYLGVDFNNFNFNEIKENMIEIYDILLQSGIIDMIEDFSGKDMERFDKLYNSFLKFETEMILKEFIKQIDSININENIINSMSKFMSNEKFMKTLDVFTLSQNKETKSVVDMVSKLAREKMKK